MKICIMCWTLLDDQLNNCNCLQGAYPSVFFRNTSEMVSHFVTHERLVSKRARILEELVKKEIKENYEGFAGIERLRELVEESEITDKEKESEGKS